LTDFLRRLGRGTGPRAGGSADDAELLALFVARREESAFEALVRRHGPMVLAVCRQLLVDAHDAEDAFQATFLVLVRKAASLRQPELVAGFLHAVAYKIAVRARRYAARRRARERQGVEMAASRPGDDGSGRELRPLLHEELGRLPEKYRVPVVLCYLQGKTNEEAARQLAWPVGTVKGRLTRARELLRARLTRRGLTLSAAAVAAGLAQTTASGAVPAVLVRETVRAAIATAGQAAVAGVVSAHVAALTEGALRTMFLRKLMLTCAVLIGLGVGGTGAGLLLCSSGAAPPLEADKEVRALPVVRPADEPKKEDDAKAEAADRERSVNNLKQLAIALYNYHDANGTFPPSAVYSKDGKALLSWRVLVLPYLEEDQLFKQFKLEEPWDSEHNKKLLARIPKVFAPVRGKNKDGSGTYYQVFTGNGAAFDAKRGARITDFTDGTSNTILIVEAAETVPWTKPADLAFDPAKPLPKLGGLFGGEFHFALADASAHCGKKDVDEKVLKAFITRAGGEVVDFKDIQKDK
jgi:RNA polymerase sigma factor (sigma-70 family)